jgi:hypothetical protein
MSKSVERVENLIRVVSTVPDDKFDIRRWYSAKDVCGCAIGHALQDSYFVSEGLTQALLTWSNAVLEVSKFFDISESRAIDIFTLHVGGKKYEERYETRQDVLSALRVLLMEKMVRDVFVQSTSISVCASCELETA